MFSKGTRAAKRRLKSYTALPMTVKWVKPVRYNFLYLFSSSYNKIINEDKHMPIITGLYKVIGFAAILGTLALAPELSAKTPDCKLRGGHAIGAGSNSLLIASNTSFDPYSYVIVNPVYVDNGRPLSEDEQAKLETTFKHTIEQDWQERLGWRSSKRAGRQVVELNIHINDVVIDEDNSNTSVLIDFSLNDSLSGEPLMAHCNETLNVTPQIAALAQADSISWSGLQNTVRYWGAGLGSHIMTPY